MIINLLSKSKVKFNKAECAHLLSSIENQKNKNEYATLMKRQRREFKFNLTFKSILKKN